jgi:hypothetical protein
MNARRGQIALYLVAVLTAVVILAVMNVSVFLAVRAKNRAMNAGDAAALAVAKHQGELLNRIGEANIAHLKAAIANDAAACALIMARQRRLCFLGPLEGLSIGNDAARRNGVTAEGGAGMLRLLRDHALLVRDGYAANPQLYPPPWEGAWEEYAARLEVQVGALGDGLVVAPDNVEFADAWQCFPLLSRQFYHAIAGRNWCWFHFNGEWLFDRDSQSMPRPDFSRPSRRDNSEIYSLHLTFAPLPADLDETWINLIRTLTGCSEEEIERSDLLKDRSQEWAFYDSRWRDWWEISPNGPWRFPAAGEVKEEYDVLGCAAVCRVVGRFSDLVAERDDRQTRWVAAAKPFGTVEMADGTVGKVTDLERLVTPAFSDVRLVPIDTAGGQDLATADVDWMDHVRRHLPLYYEKGPLPNGCYYCRQLVKWENVLFRRQGKDWLEYNAGSCRRPTGGSGGSTGGTPHGH